MSELTPSLAALSGALLQAGEAILKAATGMAAFIQRFVSSLPYIYGNMDKIAALVEAPPRVRRLALYGKKYRTRKKNINRALREKAKREKRSRR